MRQKLKDCNLSFSVLLFRTEVIIINKITILINKYLVIFLIQYWKLL